MSKSKTRKARPLAERQPVPPADSARPPGKEAAGSPQHPRESSKQAIMVGLLSRPKGAILSVRRGWLPHTARAALSGLRRRGFAIERVAADDGRNLYKGRGRGSRQAGQEDPHWRAPRLGKARGAGIALTAAWHGL